MYGLLEKKEQSLQLHQILFIRKNDKITKLISVNDVIFIKLWEKYINK